MLSLPLGFRFAGVSCGIKKAADRRDLTLVVGDGPLVGAGVYTQNQVCAAPVRWCRQRTPSPQIRAVVVNSGNANACTGDQGEADTVEMASRAAAALGCRAEEVLVMSTGIIGVPLPMDRVRRGIDDSATQLANTEAAFLNAVDGIMTTDNGRKTSHATCEIDGQTLRISGMCKGAGMIGPNMATMLGIVTTDAAIDVDDAQTMLAEIADDSFNAISVEGHTSTNDSLVLLCSGAACPAPLKGAALEQFRVALRDMCIQLARQIPADGEGATHVMEIRVQGAPDRAAARHICKTIADSALVKTAIHGGDPNWGRIVSAAGYSGVPLDLNVLSLHVNGFPLFRHGQPLPFDASKVSWSMRDAATVVLELQVGTGPGEATFWSSDLTVEYVRFNAEYTT